MDKQPLIVPLALFELLKKDERFLRDIAAGRIVPNKMLPIK